MKVNNYDCGVYQESEIYIQVNVTQLRATGYRVFLTERELYSLLDLLKRDENRRNADRIDGHDRDDLGESPDY